MTTQPAPPLPDVTVLIPVHNGLPYLEEALRSIMTQTLRNIEILVIDDASTDGSPDVLARLAAEDPRIRVETLPTNYKLPRALNHGLTLARAPLIARMDADDIALPQRLEIQKRYMDAHPDVVLMGTSYDQIDPNGKVFLTSVRPRDDFATRWIARFNMPLTHPTFIMRNGAAPDGQNLAYDSKWTVTEDFDFVIRMMELGKVVCIPDVLLKYRVHSASVTGKNWPLQNQQMSEISERHLKADIGDEVATALSAFRAMFYMKARPPLAEVFDGFRVMIKADLTRNPTFTARRKQWMRRQSAQLILRSMQRASFSKTEIIRAFGIYGRDFLPDLVWRALEIKRVLPSSLRSDPKV